MKILKKGSLLLVLLMCGCSIKGLAEQAFPNNTIPPLDMSSLISGGINNSSLPEAEITLPNGGNSYTAQDFLTYYDDGQNYHNNDYVLANFEDAEESEREILNQVYKSFKDYTYFHEDNAYTGRYEGYNLISILSETLELKFTHPELTPNIWKVMNHGMYFENYYVSEFQEGATCNSEYMAHSGLFPNVDSSWGNNMCQNKLSTNNIFKFAMPAQLRANDYDTYYFHSGYRNFYNRGVFIPNFGFPKDNIKFLENLRNKGFYPDTDGDGRENLDYFSDDKMTIFFDEFLDASKYENGDKNFYVSMLTYSMHGAYSESNPLAINEERINRVLTSLGTTTAYFEGHDEVLYYLAKLTAYDDFIGNLIAWLEEHNLADNTIIAIYRDHHPYMMNQNHYVWYMNEVIEGGFKSTDLERFRQPLIIFEAGNLSKEQELIKEAGSNLDLAPTFLNLLGAQASYRHFHGIDILSGKSYAFLSKQNNSKTNELLIDRNGNVLEIGKNSEDIDALLYLAIKVKQLEIVTDMINTNYFKYYYYQSE